MTAKEPFVGGESLRGHLLIAGPDLWDPNFRRTVVAIVHHDDDGVLGVVLNRASDVRVLEAVPPLAGLVSSDERLFVGGPVQPDAAVILAEFREAPAEDALAFGTIGFLAGEVPGDVGETIVRARVFAGYAGWGAGQLEAELEEGSWLVEPALPRDVFTDEPDRLWSAVVRRKGSAFELLSTMPDDPRSN